MKKYAVWYDNGTGYLEADKNYRAWTAKGALVKAGGPYTKFGTKQVVTKSWEHDPNRDPKAVLAS